MATTTKELRLQNRASVLREIVLRGTVTRGELAVVTRLSAATIANVVAGLLEEGLVREDGTQPSRGGRPSTVLAVRADGAAMLGVDVGERGVAVELFDLAMRRLDREFSEVPEREATPDQIRGVLDSAVTKILDRNPAAAERVIGIGLGLPGIVEDAGHGPDALLYAQSLGWDKVRVGDLVDARGLPVSADNGAKTLATAERWFGALRGVDDALVALLGRGVGLAILSDGRLARGSRSSAGEWGHTRVAMDGPPCRCGARGCLEAYVGAHAILERWRDRGAVVEGEGWRALSSLFDAARDGDAAARQTVDETLEILGVALANLVNLTNPATVLVGGWVGLLVMASEAERLEQHIRKAALRRPGSQFDLGLCRFEGDSVSMGAALLPLQQLILRPRDD